MPKYVSQLQSNGNIKVRDFTSLQELPRIFVNVTKAIGMFVDIWLGTTHFLLRSICIFLVKVKKSIHRVCTVRNQRVIRWRIVKIFFQLQQII